eukprot:11639306-Alexandrium_andersonii.AAC.1
MPEGALDTIQEARRVCQLKQTLFAEVAAKLPDVSKLDKTMFALEELQAYIPDSVRFKVMELNTSKLLLAGKTEEAVGAMRFTDSPLRSQPRELQCAANDGLVETWVLDEIDAACAAENRKGAD